jgi:hypothetical protein
MQTGVITGVDRGTRQRSACRGVGSRFRSAFAGTVADAIIRHFCDLRAGPFERTT